MSKYIIAPEGCKWSTCEAANHESAYSLNFSWYKPSTRTAVIDASTGATKIFTRELDAAGNLIRVIEHNAQEVIIQ